MTAALQRYYHGAVARLPTAEQTAMIAMMTPFVVLTTTTALAMIASLGCTAFGYSHEERGSIATFFLGEKEGFCPTVHEIFKSNVIAASIAGFSYCITSWCIRDEL
jgi:hypothetical protein